MGHGGDRALGAQVSMGRGRQRTDHAVAAPRLGASAAAQAGHNEPCGLVVVCHFFTIESYNGRRDAFLNPKSGRDSLVDPRPLQPIQHDWHLRRLPQRTERRAQCRRVVALPPRLAASSAGGTGPSARLPARCRLFPLSGASVSRPAPDDRCCSAGAAGAASPRRRTSPPQRQWHRKPAATLAVHPTLGQGAVGASASNHQPRLHSQRLLGQAKVDSQMHHGVHRPVSHQLHVAVDQRDPLLDNPEAQLRIIAAAPGLRIHFDEPLAPAYEGRLCWIWDRMAQQAVRSGAELVLLIGDDVSLETRGWQAEVEEEFAAVARQRSLPFGAACVALRDRSFPAFPTFPVMHRFHLEVRTAAATTIASNANMPPYFSAST